MKSKSLFYIFAISWLIPIAVLSFFIFSQYQNAYTDRTESEVMNAVNISGVLIKTQIDLASSKISRQISDDEWRSQYRRVQTGELELDNYLSWIRLQLVSSFYKDEQFSCVAFYINTEDKPQAYISKGSPDSLDYLQSFSDSIGKYMQKQEKNIQVAVINGQLYLIQNLFFSIYDISYGTLVVELQKDRLFSDVPITEIENVFVEINRTGEYLTKSDYGKLEDDKMEALIKLRNGTGVNRGTRGLKRVSQIGYSGYSYQTDAGNYKLDFYYIKDMRNLYYEISRLNLIVIISVIGMMPIMMLSYYYMGKNAKYAQRMATKDAQIAALQAQINPHFLNNTLEIMNWQARMNGDTDVSKMIEALATVLDSGINREHDKLVRLADELKCADAFLYIMSMRFGDRLEVEKLVDTNLLQAMVPQLILQPILENAIKHGVESVSFGTVWLNIFEENNLLIIDVINSGKKMKLEDIDRIRRIIKGEELLSKSVPGVHTSIGIYNVNKRIELIFGEKYGLTVHLIGEDKMQFRMVMPLEERVR